MTASTINVVFPVVAINSEAGRFGFAQDKEYGEQTKAIHLYVNQINNGGGINGRKINPMIVSFDPANNANEQVAVQAVDAGQPAGLRGGRRDRDLDRGQPALRHPAGPHPAARAWSTTTNWTQAGLALPLVDRTRPGAGPGRHRGLGPELGPALHGKKVGIVVSDQAGDQAALQQLPAAGPEEGGDHPQVATVAGNPSQSATTNSDAQLAVERFKAAGVQSVSPCSRRTPSSRTCRPRPRSSTSRNCC